jgi:hypothetical protein
MPQVGFETTFPVFERAKIFRALDRAATAIGWLLLFTLKILCCTDITLEIAHFLANV